VLRWGWMAREADKALRDYDGWRLTVRQNDNGVALTGHEATKPHPWGPWLSRGHAGLTR